jgi:hypothetical protein
MESERIHDSDESSSSSHRVFRGIMLSFLFSIIIIGLIALVGIEAFAFQHITPLNADERQMGGIPEDRSAKVAEVKEILMIDEEIILPSDGFRYVFKKMGEGFREAFTFDKVDKEILNVELINERAKEIAVISAQGEPLPENVVQDYNDRVDRAGRFVQLQTDAHENIERRTEVRAAIEEHKKLVLDKIETEPSDTPFGMIISDFRQKISQIILNIDEQEVFEARNTLPAIRQHQMDIKMAEMVGDVEQIQKSMRELEIIDEKLNRLHMAQLCTEPIRTLTVDTATDFVALCPIAQFVEGQLQDEIDRVDAELEAKKLLELERKMRLASNISDRGRSCSIYPSDPGC